LLSNSEKMLSVVTISKNDLSGIKSTIESLMVQNFQFWKCLVVLPSRDDDSYVEVKQITERDYRFTLLLQQEPGIYEAMNLALDNVKTKYVWFMNGGDKFASENILSETLKIILERRCSLLIGGYSYFEAGTKRTFVKRYAKVSAERFSLNIRGGCHQSMLFDFSSNPELRFNSEFKMCADFDYVLNFIKHGAALRIDKLIAEIEPNGISSRQIFEVLKEKQLIRRQHFSKTSAAVLFGKIQNFLVITKVKLRKLRNDEIAQTV